VKFTFTSGYIFFAGDTPFTVLNRFSQSECAKKILLSEDGRKPAYEEIKKFLKCFVSFLPPLYQYGEEDYYAKVWNFPLLLSFNILM